MNLADIGPFYATLNIRLAIGFHKPLVQVMWQNNLKK